MVLKRESAERDWAPRPLYLPGDNHREAVVAPQLADDAIGVATGVIGGAISEEEGLEELYGCALGLLGRPVAFVHVATDSGQLLVLI